MRVSEKELIEVKRTMDNEKNARIFKRYMSLFLYLSGKTCGEVSEIVGISKNTVSRINQVYFKEGLEGIPDKERTGRPQRLTNEELLNLKNTILNQVPFDVGFPAEFNWTAGLISKYIERKYGHTYSIRGITAMLHRLGMSYTRPTYVLAKADKEKQEQFKEDFKGIKKTVKWRNTTHSF